MDSIAIKLNNLTRANGSALFSIGRTVIQAAVHGPTRAGRTREKPDQAIVDVTFKHRKSLPSINDPTDIPNEDYVIQNAISGALESAIRVKDYPRCIITVVVQELDMGLGDNQTPGTSALLSASINAAFLALIDAGISLNMSIAAVTMLETESGDWRIATGTECLRPTEINRRLAQVGRVDLVVENCHQKVVSIMCEGRLKESQVATALKLGRQFASEYFEHIKRVL